MSDAELITRLRDAPADGLGTENLCLEAADRIEELTTERKKAVDAFVDLALATLAEIKGESHE